MSDRLRTKRSTAQIIRKEHGKRLIQILREDSAKNKFVCRVVEEAKKANSISGQIPASLMAKVCAYIWNAEHIPEQDKPYAVAKILYNSS